MKNFTMTVTIIRNKNVISITVKRADYESKTPDYPGNHHIRGSKLIYLTPGSWIIEEDYAAVAEVCDPL